MGLKSGPGVAELLVEAEDAVEMRLDEVGVFEIQ
jgi:hypothetical protein